MEDQGIKQEEVKQEIIDLEQEERAEVELEGDTFLEQVARGIVLSYQDAFNRHNDKYEIKFTLTITNHKIATPDGNKDVAYLRLDRGIREKGSTEEKDWELRIIQQEIYRFTSMRDRLNPKTPWKEQLFMNMLTRLVGGGLEYAELLQRLKQTEEGHSLAGLPPEGRTPEEVRADKIGLQVAQEMPKELTDDEKQYVEWIKKEKEKEGISNNPFTT